MRQNDPYQTQLAVNKSKSTGVQKNISKTTATQTTYHKKKPVGKMLLFGAMSLAAYTVLMTKETLITNTFTLGGWYAVLPVGTAFAFSFIHGAFSSNFISVLGLEPKKS